LQIAFQLLGRDFVDGQLAKLEERILKINDPVEKERVTATVRAILEHEPRKKPAKTV